MLYTDPKKKTMIIMVSELDAENVDAILHTFCNVPISR